MDLIEVGLFENKVVRLSKNPPLRDLDLDLDLDLVLDCVCRLLLRDIGINN